MSPPQAYVLCTSPRSGSTLLCSLLRATGAAGHPASWFHESSLEAWADDLEVATPFRHEEERIAGLVDAAKVKGRAGGPLFALRLQRQSAPFLLRTLERLHPDAADDLTRIEQSFGETRFIHLTRLDKVAQAVSYMRARQSGLWHRAADGSELERLAPHREPHYDAVFLSEWVGTFTRYDAAWRDWFAQEGIKPLVLTYETLTEDPADCVRQVLETLSLDPHLADDATPGVQRLADAQSLEWIERFKRNLS